jgi:hypothetical protein
VIPEAGEPATPPKPEADALIHEIEQLRELSVPALRARYRELFGYETTNRSKDYLQKRIIYRIQERLHAAPAPARSFSQVTPRSAGALAGAGEPDRHGGRWTEIRACRHPEASSAGISPGSTTW